MDTHAVVLIRKNNTSESNEYSVVDTSPSKEDALRLAESCVGSSMDILSVVDIAQVVNIRDVSYDLFIVDEYGSTKKVIRNPSDLVMTASCWISLWEDEATEYGMITIADDSNIGMINMLRIAIECSIYSVNYIGVLDKFHDLLDLLNFAENCLTSKKRHCWPQEMGKQNTWNMESNSVRRRAAPRGSKISHFCCYGSFNL